MCIYVSRFDSGEGSEDRTSHFFGRSWWFDIYLDSIFRYPLEYYQSKSIIAWKITFDYFRNGKKEKASTVFGKSLAVNLSSFKYWFDQKNYAEWSLVSWQLNLFTCHGIVCSYYDLSKHIVISSFSDSFLSAMMMMFWLLFLNLAKYEE